jgi:hypothetical protein
LRPVKLNTCGDALVILRDSTFDVKRGRLQRAVVPLVCGAALMIFPYLVSYVMLLVGIGALLIVIPYFLRP